MIDKRNTRNEKNAQTQRERDTTADMDETRLMETTTMRGVILRMRMGSMRMGQEARVIGQPRTPNGDRLAVFTSQQDLVKSDLRGRLLDRVIVTDTHKHIDRVLCTYMTSYLPQTYRLSILIDKQALFINSWLIRLSVDNVLLINTRRLSILIDKTIPLSIDTSTFLKGPLMVYSE